MRKLIACVAGVVLLAACQNNSETENTAANETAKPVAAASQRNEAIAAIKEAEKQFALMAATKGVAKAFEFWADSNAVIKRENDTLIHSKQAIGAFYGKMPAENIIQVTWSPRFADASDDGTLGYTYGDYQWVFKNAAGKPVTSKGVFHTVWKKQPDGTWKFVWD
jgi:ketosteroid isomerase-like protein